MMMSMKIIIDKIIIDKIIIDKILNISYKVTSRLQFGSASIVLGSVTSSNRSTNTNGWEFLHVSGRVLIRLIYRQMLLTSALGY